MWAQEPGNEAIVTVMNSIIHAVSRWASVRKYRHEASRDGGRAAPGGGAVWCAVSAAAQVHVRSQGGEESVGSRRSAGVEQRAEVCQGSFEALSWYTL